MTPATMVPPITIRLACRSVIPGAPHRQGRAKLQLPTARQPAFSEIQFGSLLKSNGLAVFPVHAPQVRSPRYPSSSATAGGPAPGPRYKGLRVVSRHKVVKQAHVKDRGREG